jgi:hypothetical protein
MQVVFEYPGHVAGPYGERVTVDDSWTAWVNALTGSGYVAQAPPWVPTYEKYSVFWPDNSGGIASTALNPMQFPTRETCDHLAALFPANGKPLVVQELPLFSGGPVVSNAVKRNLIFPNGAHLEAWALANLYTNNPEDKSGYAHDAAVRMIAAVWQG